MQHVAHLTPRLKLLGIKRVRRDPCLHGCAALGRQFTVHISVEFVLGDGNVRVGHCPVLSNLKNLEVILHGAKLFARLRVLL